MPELPDIVLYLEALRPRVVGQRLEQIRVTSPLLLRTFEPPLEACQGKGILDLRRMGKRIVFQLEEDLFLVLHLMIAGRLHWRPPGAKVHGKIGLAAFDVGAGTLSLTEAGTKKRASLHVVRGEPALRALDPGGLEVLETSRDEFTRTLARENHTLKRALTDPRLFSGIGNAWSDEILHRGRLSPLAMTSKLSPEETERLYRAVVEVLQGAIDRLRKEVGSGFPEKVTAFREWMAVHGRYRKPCPDCGEPVQRIVYAENETNYCAKCQTGGRLLADRSLSRLLKEDWPRTLEELEERHRGG
jgi:formamidopyrimidine-DNA glycosylase